MSKGSPLIFEHYQATTTNGSSVIENTYLIYTPKIIKFVYHSNPNPVPLVLPLSQPPAPIPPPIELVDTKVGKQGKAPKIRLVSRGTTQINSDHNKSLQSSSKRQSAPEKKTGLRVHTVSSGSRSSNHQKQSQVPFFSCGWCGDANQEQQSFLPFPSRIQMRTAESRLIECSQPVRKPILPKSSQFIIESEEAIRLDQWPQQRKRIFDRPNKLADNTTLNRSLDDFKRSTSRKSIFSQYELRSKSQSMDLSLQRRRRIFDSPSQRRCLKLQRYQTITQIQIPLSVLASWKKQAQDLTEKVCLAILPVKQNSQ